jgi:eukaryotic-like serine/threonine-protein kinase
MPSSLPPGTKLGRYEIRSPLGAGGMGEVYLAFDSALNRKVALKILPEEFANKPLAMQRFVQEAKAASGLNHPNIITIYEIGTEPGTHFIATEFIDGETLRRHMSRSEISIGKAIDVGLQVASALSTAHAEGIIHRDIKPENIMVRRDGIVKVLDFGLAKLTERWNANEVDPDAATKAIVQTQPGVIVGTTAYMSPEQTRAVEIDTRTDIWSLGVLLYEMIAGRTPFRGETASDTSAAILKSEPTPLYEILPDIPFELERIVRKALQKDREERYQVVKDFELDLKALKRSLDLGTTLEPSLSSRAQMSLGGVRTTGSQAAPRHSTTVGIETSADRRSPTRPTMLIAGLVVVLSVGGFFLWRQLSRKSIQPSNLTVTHLTTRKNELGEGGTHHARFSPDGKFIVYSSAKDGSSPIWLKQLGGGDPFTNRTAEGVGASPIWSPDGQEIAFLSRREGQNGIWRMPAFGGAPVLIKSLERPSRGLVSWSKTGQIYFVSQGNLYSLQIANQQVAPVTNFDPAKLVDRSFGVSPDEQQIAYSDLQNGQSDLWVIPRSGGQPVRVTNDKPEDNQPVWTPENKRILYSSKRNGIKQVFLSYLDGREPVQLTINDNNTDVLDVSVDGTKILYATSREESDLWSVSIDQPKESQLTSDAGIELWPDVSPDGKSVAFQSLATNSGQNLFRSLPQVKSLTAETPITQLAPDGFALRWSPNGKQVGFLRQQPGGTPNLWTVHASGGDAKPLTTEGVVFGGYSYLPYNRFQTHDFEWSADGSRLIYCARDGGKMNVWETTADGSSKKKLSNNEEGSVLYFNPTMSTDGKTVAWLALMQPHAGKKTVTWSIWMAEEGIGREVFQSDSVVGIVGWSDPDSQLIFKTISGVNSAPSVPTDVSVSLLDRKTGQQRLRSELKATYFHNVHLAPARNAIAFVTRQDGPDSLRLISTKSGPVRTILTSNDPRVYFSSLNWSPDGKSILYGKQSTWTTFSMLDNFTSN